MNTSAVLILQWEINRGRTEVRRVIVSDYTEQVSKERIGIKQILIVHRIVKVKGRSRQEYAYFISSRQSKCLF